jgi:hypothetical protein
MSILVGVPENRRVAIDGNGVSDEPAGHAYLRAFESSELHRLYAESPTPGARN